MCYLVSYGRLEVRGPRPFEEASCKHLYGFGSLHAGDGGGSVDA